jgi:hypothetical protein
LSISCGLLPQHASTENLQASSALRLECPSYPKSIV